MLFCESERAFLRNGMKKIALGIIVYLVLSRVGAALPLSVKVVILVIAGVGIYRPLFIKAFAFCKSLILQLLDSVKKAVTKVVRLFQEGKTHVMRLVVGTKRISRLVSALFNMNQTSFESKLAAFMDSQKEPSTATTSQSNVIRFPVSYIPRSMCRQEMSDEQAYQLALAWWRTQEENGTGEERLAELLADLADSDPTKHTCVLTAI